VSHPYRPTCKFVVLYILILTNLTANTKREGSGLNSSSSFILNIYFKIVWVKFYRCSKINAGQCFPVTALQGSVAGGENSFTHYIGAVPTIVADCRTGLGGPHPPCNGYGGFHHRGVGIGKCVKFITDLQLLTRSRIYIYIYIYIHYPNTSSWRSA
jgi:hypothetical protein